MPRRINRSALLRDLIQRDHGICQICHKPVNLRAIGNSPDAPSKDHILPKSFGGSIHSMVNLRLTHVKCNQDRADAQNELVGRLMSCPRCSCNVIKNKDCHSCGFTSDRIQEYVESERLDSALS